MKTSTLESWRKKTVADNIVESWLCVDCGVNTNPGTPDGPTTRIDLALYGEATMTLTNEAEIYDIRDAIWKQAGMEAWGGCLCIGCLEQRIGRQLRPNDFSRHDARSWANMPCTDRLLDRRGFRKIRVRTEQGEEEVIVLKQVAEQIAERTPPGELPFLEVD
jgi:hypothetical protein